MEVCKESIYAFFQPKEVDLKDMIDIILLLNSIMVKAIYMTNMIEKLNSMKGIILDIIHIFVFQNSIQVSELYIADIV